MGFLGCQVRHVACFHSSSSCGCACISDCPVLVPVESRVRFRQGKYRTGMCASSVCSHSARTHTIVCLLFLLHVLQFTPVKALGVSKFWDPVITFTGE